MVTFKGAGYYLVTSDVIFSKIVFDLYEIEGMCGSGPLNYK